jgi:hypothetical protein
MQATKQTYFVTIVAWVEADSQEQAEKDAEYIVHEINSTPRATIQLTSAVISRASSTSMPYADTGRASVDSVEPTDD